MIRYANIEDLEALNLMLSYFNTSISDLSKTPFIRYLVCEVDNKLVGFLSFDDLYERLEIEYLYIKDEYRKLGYAEKLLAFLLLYAKEKDNITLEVRCSNLKAINLYKKMGFKEVNIRKNYYNSEDGILLEKKMGD